MALDLLLDALQRLPAFARTADALPVPGATLRVTGLRGSSDAVLLATLARRLPTRFFTLVAESVPEAERWLADLQTLLPDEAVVFYPPRESLGESEPHLEIAGERVETMERVSRGGVQVLLTTARAVLEKTRVPGALRTLRLELRKGELRRLTELVERLEAMGFERVPMVDDVAQFSVRGGILDVYSFGMADPVRAEFWGDEIVDLRQFDLNTQRSTRDVTHALVLPVDAPSLTTTAAAERTTLLALLPPDTVLVEPVGTAFEPELARTWEEAQHHVEFALRRGEDPAPREELFESPERVMAGLAALGTLRLVPAGTEADVDFALHEPETVDRDIKWLRRLVRDRVPTIILCDNSGQAERLEELLSEDEASPSPAALVVGVLQGGFVVPPLDGGRGLRVLTDHEVFRRERRIRRKRRYVSGIAVDTAELRAGDYVVHLEQGVGIYRGMETLVVGQSTLEVAVVEYEGGDRLNVPLYRIDQLERYRSASDISENSPPPRLHKLGGKRWAQQRDKTRSAIREMTVELLDLYARRKVATRPPHVPDTPWQKQLESSFLFEDTPDQRTATVAVKQDMESTRPMDRLLVGDVGYGKTEIAVRAAFKAVQSGRQVAVLVPTTILADQHARTFTERLADFPVRIEMLSRFQTARQQKEVVDALADHKVDIVIGTHRLLSPDVKFDELGLLVIDEEHRFGVKHKERLKQLRLETDVLTLTATPIPRTLHMSLAGLRDLTLMQTRAARPVARAHLAGAVGRRAHGGGHRPRAGPRGAGVLRAQPHRDHRRHCRPPAAGGAARPDRGGARPDEGTRTGTGDAPVRERRREPAGLDDDRGERARRAQRQHHVRQPRRPVRSGAALPAPGARGPLAPPRLLLPAGARRDGPGGRAPVARAGAPYRTRGGVPHRAARHGDARCREPAGAGAVRVRADRRVRPLPAPPRRGGPPPGIG